MVVAWRIVTIKLPRLIFRVGSLESGVYSVGFVCVCALKVIVLITSGSSCPEHPGSSLHRPGFSLHTCLEGSVRGTSNT